jgi:hypothetical protein
MNLRFKGFNCIAICLLLTGATEHSSIAGTKTKVLIAQVEAKASGCKLAEDNPEVHKKDANCKKVMILEAATSPKFFNAFMTNSFKQPPYPAGDWGDLLEVKLDAPGPIYQVDYSCEGKACGWTHECPDGGKCGPQYLYRVVFNGNSATWYGWSNSGAAAVLKFAIHYQ